MYIQVQENDDMILIPYEYRCSIGIGSVENDEASR